MADDRTPDDRKERPSVAANSRKPYQKPGFRYERVFETAALACGKLVSVQSTCIVQQKTS